MEQETQTTGFNAQLIALLDGSAVWISGPLPGKTHDAKAFKETGAADIVKESGGGFGDKGYQGSGLVTPKKKPKGGELTMSDKEYNSQIASFRAPVETCRSLQELEDIPLRLPPSVLYL